MGRSTVMLSTCATLSVNFAKHLAAQRDRPFAALRVTVEGDLEVLAAQRDDAGGEMVRFL